MSVFKAILNSTSIIAALILGLVFSVSPLKIKAQDSIVQKLDYLIKIDTIQTYDTTYIIDTLITPRQIIKIDTIRISPERESTSQNIEGNIGFTINQLAVTHWAAGGESNASGKINANFKHTLKRRKFSYMTTGIFAYGISGYAKSKRIEKTEDRFELATTISNNNQKHLTFTSITTLKTQFTNGYAYPNDSVPISRFFAPAYLTISMGYTYTINKYLSVFMSPMAGKMTFVMDQELADKGAFGVEAGYWNIIEGDSTWVSGKKFFAELGINILVSYSQQFDKNISIFSTLNLYNNYLDANRSNRWNIDIDWETGIKFLITKRISTILNIHMIYDDNIKFAVTEIENGVEVTKERPTLQFKESLGITFLFNFAK
ncbi:MAG: DUF3078 domain-containing protein [Bacteroidales bacterium]|nr:DUF3078 domain-containing protein [Bacteroidales bacterium]